MTVPDIDTATQFFATVLGAKLASDLVVEPLSGPDVETALGLPQGATIRRVRMLAVADGAGIELFEIDTRIQATPPRLSDLGIQHLAVEVDDIHTAIAHVGDAGGRMLADPAPVPGTTDGSVWAYCELPWGGLMELMHHPADPR